MELNKDDDLLEEIHNPFEMDEIIMKLRYFHHYSMKKNYKLFGAEQNVGYSAVESAFDAILSQGAVIIYEHHLESKKYSHVFLSTTALAELNCLTTG